MKARLFLTVATLLAGAACAPSEGGIQTAIALTQMALPTQTSIPPTPTATFTPAPSPTYTLTPTDTPSPTPSMFFTEEFDQPLNEFWALSLFGPNKDEESEVETEVSDSRLRVKISREDIYAYYFFEQFSYPDVRLDLRAENRGVNNNNVTLVCRKSEDGWIEFNVTSGGSWYLLAFVSKGSDAGYYSLKRGGTFALEQGKALNDYTLICNGDNISMFINGSELKQSPYDIRTFINFSPSGARDDVDKLNEGAIGFSISSFNVIPVNVEIDWLKISTP